MTCNFFLNSAADSLVTVAANFIESQFVGCWKFADSLNKCLLCSYGQEYTEVLNRCRIALALEAVIGEGRKQNTRRLIKR